MKQLALAMGLILLGIVILSLSKSEDKTGYQIVEEHEEGYYDLIGQEALKHL